MPIDAPRNNLITGARYMFEGARLLLHPKLRPYILVPLIVNCVLFIVLTSVLLSYFWTVFNEGSSWIPESIQPWVAPFAWFVWFIVGVLFLIVYGYSFNVITNIIAAPFYGLLAESVERVLTGQGPPEESLSAMIFRTLGREFSKLMYFLGRGLLIILVMVLVGFIPLVQVLAPLIGMLWGAWSMAIQYADYPADNHQLPFSRTRLALWNRMASTFGFGSCLMTCSVIPIVNIFAMPAAVAGGTLFWLKELKEQVELDKRQ
ncbi:sulfate transporter CysZ [Agaribacterium haliotis]|uniref:sulfate transporter CysZ n=1 Tax=Agaribacterium haliotis TaxID=2013869 RepID=UPI001EFC87FF|nr:sulfate transporter CysZ [Agaribacterium haliotis]